MDILDFAMMYWQRLLLGGLSTALTVYLIYKNREALALMWLGFRHRNFLFGKVKTLAKDSAHTDGWFHSEMQICQDYKPHYQRINKSPEYYRQCKQYLEIVGEAGRKPLTIPLIIVLFAVLVLEAWGFSYTMSGFLDITASENTRQIMAWILAITFAVTLATVTHRMGHEIHRNKLIHNIRELWIGDDDPEKRLVQQANVGAGAIEHPTDVNEKPYIRRLNRLELGKSHKTYFWTASAITVIAVIAIFLTFIRMKALEQAQTQDTLCNVNGVSQPASGGGAPNFDTLYGDAPSSVIDTNQEAVNSGKSDICKATEEGSWATFGLLAIIFCVLQTFATWASVARGFAGAQSREAYDATYKHKTEDDFVSYYEDKMRSIIDLAQKSLVMLQSNMAEKLPAISPSAEVNELLRVANKRTFFTYIQKDHSDMLQATLNRQQAESDAVVKAAEQDLTRQSKLNEIEVQKAADEAAAKDKMKERLAQFAAAKAAEEPKETEQDKNDRLVAELEADLGRKLSPEERAVALGQEETTV